MIRTINKPWGSEEEDSEEWVTERGRQSRTSVSGSTITPRHDLKQRSAMLWYPDEERSLYVCVSERIGSFKKRDCDRQLG